ncbi:hypothetical protein [Streptomyces fagopyri]|uniref:hypothetical protein n=1 Tax=Streptomyces fagopyri TaxID=2662397 RepID=UPI00371FD91A
MNDDKTVAPNRGTTGVADHMAKSTEHASLWASSTVTQLLDGQDDPPKYGSTAWRRLSSDNPRKVAATVMAAEMWRKYGDEEALLTWFRDASRSRDFLASRRTIAELDALAKPKPPRPVQAATGWPPVAIPGRPGWRRHLVDGQQVDMPDNAQENRA